MGPLFVRLGNNEEGTRYSGIDTDRMKILAYVLCSFFAGIAGILFAFELDSVQPAQTGEFYELYAIAAAVLGGCSLRGGEGTVLGVVIAAAVIRLIYNSINMVGISTHLEFGILGLVILLGVIGDEFLKKTVARKQAAQRLNLICLYVRDLSAGIFYLLFFSLIPLPGESPFLFFCTKSDHPRS